MINASKLAQVAYTGIHIMLFTTNVSFEGGAFLIIAKKMYATKKKVTAAISFLICISSDFLSLFYGLRL